MKNKIINSLKKNKKKILYSSNLIILLVPIGILALNKYNATINNNLNNKNWIKNNTSIIKTNINEYTYSTMKDKHITTYNTLFQEEIDNNIIVNSAQQCTFQETNQDGNIKKKFIFNCKSSIYHVFKYNFNNLCLTLLKVLFRKDFRIIC